MSARPELGARRALTGNTIMKPIFRCRECGHCCQGETTVSLNKDDLRRMAAYLRMEISEVKKRYLRDTNGVIQMKIKDGHCVFYKDGCTVHPGKPWRCAEWPLHPSILADQANFETIKASCPGIDKEIGYEEFCRRLRAMRGGEE